MKKTVAFILAAALCLLFVACGSSNNTPVVPTSEPAPTEQPAAPTLIPMGNENITWGNLSIYVPEGFEFSGGIPGDGENPNGCIIMNSQDINKRCTVLFTDSENISSELDKIKGDNETTDIEPLKLYEITWEGVSYKAAGDVTAYAIYANMGSNDVLVKSYGLDLNDEGFTQILESIWYKG